LFGIQMAAQRPEASSASASQNDGVEMGIHRESLFVQR